MRAMALAAAVALAFAGPALAQGPITTAPAAGPAVPQPTAASPPLPSSIAGPGEGEQIAMGPCGPEKVKPDGRLDTAPHGELEAGVGTGGYRHLSGVVCKPIGQDGAVTIGASETQFNERYRRR